MKKKLTMMLSVALIAVMAICGTLAYLTSTDSDVNTMTLGNVEIDQIEYQRAKDDDGNFKTKTIDEKNSYVLEPFEQNKPLYPSFEQNEAEWDEDATVRLTQVDSYGGMQVFENELAQDKFVFVKNTGKNDAFVRTIIAFEAGSATMDEWKDLIGTSHHFTWDDPEEFGIVEINGNNYAIVEFVYKGWEEGDRHVNGVLPAGELTYCNLAQVYMKAHATNEDVEKLDGDKDGTYDILVLSQAVQTEGFENAQTALDTGFGDVNEANVQKWFKDVTVKVEVDGNTKDALGEAIEKAPKGATVVLTGDINLDNVTYTVEKDVDIDLNGYTVTSSARNGVFYLKNGASLTNGTIIHNGTVAGIKVWQAEKIENITLNLAGKSNAGNAITGISIQEGSSTYVKSLKNVTITGEGENKTYNGVETYNCGNREMNNYAIGSMENVNVNVNGTALLLSAPAGTATNCEFNGDTLGINAHLKGAYNVSLKLMMCKVSEGITIWDEVNKTNPGSLKIEAEGTTVEGTIVNNPSEQFGDRWIVTGLSAGN